MSEAASPSQNRSRALDAAIDRIRDAQSAGEPLLQDLIDGACQRLSLIARDGGAARIERLIQSRAWTDAALALIELELPQWHIRRIVYDAGQWHCALSRQRELPDWLDPSVEVQHADLALAILSAFVRVLRIEPSSMRTSVPSVSRTTASLDESMSCDNFA